MQPVYSTHVFAGPLSPGAALIVISCDTKLSAYINHITMKYLTYLYGYGTIWKWSLILSQSPVPGGPCQLPSSPGWRLISIIMYCVNTPWGSHQNCIWKRSWTMRRTSRAPRRPPPESWRPPNAPQSQHLGTLKHCFTKTSGNQQNVKRKGPLTLTLTLTDWSFPKISLKPATPTLLNGALSHELDLMTYFL